ncbi:hypothetical protein DDB_G0279757 [Dictyostelium discoideum AX4]|uniref:Cln5-like protein 2 n=1 Tax=Dictyostelium discoideum TaxID=44689 RepID=CLN5B_DICDI|nr:hypothetical protein DDB_G0279757 [Dictyostelium discoideum AX4]Q54WC3.1 RecName: Full=Cln5-like protein 2; Flags: Precursor [Dictyostelium discoideum]EAL67558.1 hypothetical protein DDB_G0279757 [Dictyostelium discoideum AX4]|eukprot:XP_641535.1 hypothetical protein DDB_G0279757 [Dictyostelium discoideum AX4]
MNKLIFIIICLGIVDKTISSDFKSYNDGIYSFTYDNICSFKNSIRDQDVYELYYVQAPLLYATYGNLLEKINAYHSGIVLYNKNNGPNITIDYYAIPSFEATLFPKSIIKDSQGNYNITWDTHGLIEVTNYINETYWNKRQLIMYDLSGIQIKQYLSWAPIYNKTHTFYNLFNIESDLSISNSSKIYKNSSTCDDFVWASFDVLYKLGGTIASVQSDPQRDDIKLFISSGEPKIVDYNDSIKRNQIASFFNELKDFANLGKNKTALEIFNELITFFNGYFYCYIDGEYYEMKLSKQNPISFTYLPSPIPIGKRNFNEIKKLGFCK